MSESVGMLFPRPSPGARARWIAPLVCFALAALPVGRSLVDPGRVFTAAGEATRQLPWRAALSGEPRAPERPDLSDQAMAFYPAYRFVSESWRAGDPPLWNPLVHAGVPWLANPQWGVLDPQVLALVGLDALGGQRAFDWGFALLAWLRLGVSAWGAWQLARALGLGTAGAACAGIGFACSGSSLAWVGFSVGHVTPLLPWLLLCVERVLARPSRRSCGILGLTSALAILGGHPETAFFVLLSGVVWVVAAWRRDARAAWLALGGMAAGALASAVVTIPFLEYLAHSAALLAHRAAHPVGAPVDLLALGLVLLLVGIVQLFAGRSAGASFAPRVVSGGLVVALLGVLVALGSRGLPESWPATFVHDVLGAPDHAGGYRGPASFGEATSNWTPALVPLLALAAVLCRRARVQRKTVLAWLGFGALAFASGLPALVDAWRWLPLVGSAATARAAAVSALCLSVLAGAGLESASRAARVAAGIVLAAVVAIAFALPRPAPLAEELRETDRREELVSVREPPPAVLAGGRLEVSGWIHPALEVHSARLVLVPLDDRGRERGERLDAPVALAGAQEREGEAGRPPGAQDFESRHLEAKHLHEGNWRIELALERREPDGSPRELGMRLLGYTCVRRDVRPSVLSAVLFLLALASALLAGERPVLRALALLVALAQGVHFARAATGWTPSEEVFPASATSALLRERQGFARLLGGPGVFPYDTVLAHGLRGLDGYDALDVASFDAYRPYALRAGAHPILDWNARGVDLASPAFRLLGAHWLVLAEELDAPGWELVAGPIEHAPERAECFVYRARDPLPRAFCVSEIVPREEVLGDLEGFDPHRTAFLAPGHEIALAEPFRSAHAEIVELTNDRVRVRAELDGDGLLVLTEQSFPGWRVSVDGEERALATVDSIFRGVVLEAGAHEVVFRYRPRSFLAGALAALVGWSLLVFLCLARRR